MNIFKKALLACGMALFASVGIAQAGTYTIKVYNGTNPTPGANNAFEAALPGVNSIFNPSYSKGTFTYTGNINFSSPAGGTNTIAAFLGSAGGSFSPSVAGLTQTFSGAGFTITTGLAITFTTAYSEILTISHDDGVSLFKSGGGNQLPASSADPTVDVKDTVKIGPGTYTLYYIEANGLPAKLTVAVPEPVSLSLLGAGLLGLGLARRRRNVAA